MDILPAWYPLAPAIDVTRELSVLKIGDQQFVCWRDHKGTPNAVIDICGHQGASLSRGKLSQDGSTSICPYHGWCYDGTGACTDIPSEPVGRKTHSRVRIAALLVSEYRAFIWGFLISDLSRQAPLTGPAQPEFEDPDKPSAHWIHGSMTVRAPMSLVIANQTDLTHAISLHPEHPQAVRAEQHGRKEIHYTLTQIARPPQVRVQGHDTDRTVSVDIAFYALNKIVLSRPHQQFKLVTFVTPMTAPETHVTWFTYSPHMEQPHVANVLRTQIETIAEQDKHILELAARNVSFPTDAQHMGYTTPADTPRIYIQQLLETLTNGSTPQPAQEKFTIMA